MTLRLYGPLDPTQKQIRLLHFAGPHELAIKAYSLDSAPPYAALSYTWGDCQAPWSVTLNGQSVPIRNNLHQALQDLQALTRNTDHAECTSAYSSSPPSEIKRFDHFWIDALCINQADIAERSQQVGLMKQIYTQALTVAVWLERDCEEEVEALRLYSSDGVSKMSDPYAVPLACPKFLESPYWQRLWTLQEFILADDMIFVSGRAAVSRAKVRLVLLELAGNASKMTEFERRTFHEE